MKLNKNAEIIKGQKDIYTDMAIAAHQDDVEIMCPQAIARGYKSEAFGLVAVIASNGSGSPRSGEYASMSDREMIQVRRQEQIDAAKIGDYSSLVLLNFNSAQIKDMSEDALVLDFVSLIKEYAPSVIYTHNLADKHPTHVAVVLKCVKAIRMLEKDERPLKLYGCEVWRSLDWLSDEEKVVFNLSGYEELLDKVLLAHKSQIEGGKRYDLAAKGRRRANATYAQSHGVDEYSLASYAMDLTPLIIDDNLDPKEFIVSKIQKLIGELLI